MTAESSKPVVIVGLVRINEHCTFSWEQAEGVGARTIAPRSTHCAECIEQLRRLGYVVLEQRPERRS